MQVQKAVRRQMLADGGDGVAGSCGDACVALGTIGQHCFQRNQARSASALWTRTPSAERS